MATTIALELHNVRILVRHYHRNCASRGRSSSKLLTDEALSKYYRTIEELTTKHPYGRCKCVRTIIIFVEPKLWLNLEPIFRSYGAGIEI